MLRRTLIEPLTRVERRRAERALARSARRAPWRALERAIRFGSQQGAGFAAVLARPAVALVVASAFLAGSVTQVTVTQIGRDRAHVASVAAQAAADAHVARVVQAQTTRLDHQAIAYGAQRRTEALTIARAAVRDAGTLTQTVSAVVGAETLSPLDAAVAELDALLASTPDAAQAVVAVRAAADATVEAAAETAKEAAQAEETLAPTVPGSDAVALLAGTPDVGEAPDPAATPTQAGSAWTVGTGFTAVGAGEQGDVSDLDLDVSAQVVAAAEHVLVLSAQVQAAADAAIAAAQAAAAQAAAEAAARQAAQDALDAVARKVAAADAAANGEIPQSVLCGVGFQSGVLLRCDAALALEGLDAAYHAATGSHLSISSSYRDLAAQVATRAARGTLAGLPGTSNHGRGLAIDLADAGDLGDFSTPLYRWLVANAGDAGWHHPSYMEPGGAGPLEPWHWEFDTE